MSRWVVIGMAVAAASTAAAQEAPAFPPSLEREPLLLWLQRETDISPERVVAVTAQALTSVVSTFPAGGGAGPRVVIRAEALSAETFARTSALSWHVSMSADCDNRRVRLGETTGYPQRNLLGDRRVLRSAETEWRRPEPGTALDNAWRAACEPSFKGPFQSASVRVAQIDPPEAPPVAAPAAPIPMASRTEPRPPSPPPMVPPPVAPRPAPPPPMASPVAPAAQPAQPRATSGLVAQVGAVGSDAEARGLLRSLAPAAGRPVWVERADVSGRIWHRALVGGFAGADDAKRFCAAVKAGGRDCFLRTDSKNRSPVG
jgi:hypothetical protein